MSLFNILKGNDRQKNNNSQETPTGHPDVKKHKRLLKSQLQTSIKDDLHYAKKGDRELTEDEKKEITEYWKPYQFAFTPDFRTFQVYYNRTGIRDPRFVPYCFRRFFGTVLRNEKYRVSFQDKVYLPKIYPHIRQPKMIMINTDEYILDGNYLPITSEEAAGRISRLLDEGGEAVLKSTNSGGGGISVMFLKDLSREKVQEILKEYYGSFIVQEAVKQHPDMAALNPSTVNCLRIITFLFRGQVHALSAIVKIGSPKARVDNYKHGGLICGIDMKTGKTKPYALDIDYNQVTTTPSGVDLSEGYPIPFFHEAVEAAVRSHYDASVVKMIGWDIAIDSEGPVLIEPNFSCDYKMNQVVSGPLFGDLADEIFDEYFNHKFYRLKNNREWLYREYADRIELQQYIGAEKHVTLPETLDGKSVVLIRSKCFYQNPYIRSVTISDSVKEMKSKALAECPELKNVILSRNMRIIPNGAFRKSEKLESVEGLDHIDFIGSDAFYLCSRMPDTVRFAHISKQSEEADR
ncbi:MAG: sugar-transfer associated ATP-grasp domain-containing protein [Eubacterium sp.]